MFKYIYIKTNLYKILSKKKYKIKNFEKNNIIVYSLVNNKNINIGNITYNINKNYIIYLNKPFFFFNITRVPKSYPFKEIKN